MWPITGAVDQWLKKAAEVRGGWGTGNGCTVMCYLSVPHLLLAMWYFRCSAPHLREHMDLVNLDLCAEMTVPIDHCQQSYRIGMPQLLGKISYNKHGLNSTIKRTDQY